VTLQSQLNTDALGNTVRIINQPEFYQSWQGRGHPGQQAHGQPLMLLASHTASKSWGMNAGSGSRDPARSRTPSPTSAFGRDPNDFINADRRAD
jgi:hypothetical protein